MRLTAGDLPKVSHAKSWIERDRLRRNIRSHGFETHASCLIRISRARDVIRWVCT